MDYRFQSRSQDAGNFFGGLLTCFINQLFIRYIQENSEVQLQILSWLIFLGGVGECRTLNCSHARSLIHRIGARFSSLTPSFAMPITNLQLLVARR